MYCAFCTLHLILLYMTLGKQDHSDFRTSGKNTIVALRIVKDTIRLFGSEISVPTKDLLTAARKAHPKYQLYLEEQ